jgi:hypothetical protein
MLAAFLTRLSTIFAKPQVPLHPKERAVATTAYGISGAKMRKIYPEIRVADESARMPEMGVVGMYHDMRQSPWGSYTGITLNPSERRVPLTLAHEFGHHAIRGNDLTNEDVKRISEISGRGEEIYRDGGRDGEYNSAEFLGRGLQIATERSRGVFKKYSDADEEAFKMVLQLFGPKER